MAATVEEASRFTNLGYVIEHHNEYLYPIAAALFICTCAYVWLANLLRTASPEASSRYFIYVLWIIPKVFLKFCGDGGIVNVHKHYLDHIKCNSTQRRYFLTSVEWHNWTRSKALVCLATAVCIRKAENAKKGTEKKGEVVSWNKPRLEDDIYLIALPCINALTFTLVTLRRFNCSFTGNGVEPILLLWSLVIYIIVPFLFFVSFFFTAVYMLFLFLQEMKTWTCWFHLTSSIQIW